MNSSQPSKKEKKVILLSFSMFSSSKMFHLFVLCLSLPPSAIIISAVCRAHVVRSVGVFFLKFSNECICSCFTSSFCKKRQSKKSFFVSLIFENDMFTCLRSCSDDVYMYRGFMCSSICVGQKRAMWVQRNEDHKCRLAAKDGCIICKYVINKSSILSSDCARSCYSRI